jgi:phosphatidylglycerophosphatase A
MKPVSLRPPVQAAARTVFADPVHFLAFGFGSGLSPWAPGTAGTLVGIPFFYVLLQAGLLAYVAATLLLGLAGVYLCGESAKRLGVHDHRGIVWDEIVGYLITMLPVMVAPPNGITVWMWVIAGFFIFRFFDVVKPPPASWADEKVHGGVGIMLDDVIAAVYSAGVVALFLYASKFLALG